MNQQFLTVLLLAISTSTISSYGAKEDGEPWNRVSKSPGIDSADTAQTCKIKPDHYWNQQFESCLPCTRCHALGLLTLRGCAPNKDVVCGTMLDFQKQMEQQFERRGRSEEKRSNWQPYRVALSDEARGPDSEDEAEAEDEDDDDAVYGKQVKFASGNVNKNKDNKDKWGNRRTGGATQKIRQTVKNSSQRKREFLRQIQEAENMTRNQDNGEEKANGPFDEQPEGMVKFSEDENSEAGNWVRKGADLHEDLRLIEKELLNGGFDRNSKKSTTEAMTASTTVPETTTTATTTRPIYIVPTYAWPPTPKSDTIPTSIRIKPLRTTTLKTTTTTTTTQTTTTTSTTATTTAATTTRSTTLPLWLRHDYNLDEEEVHEEDDDDENEISGQQQQQQQQQHGKKKMFPAASFDNVGTENDADEVFGAVVKNPSYDESEADRSSPDEFGLLSRLLYRNAEDGKGSHNKSKTAATAAGDDHSLHLTHALIVVGFLIGFSLVFGVGIVYTKVIRVRRFKLLDNRASNVSSLGEASLLASRTSSFQRNAATTTTSCNNETRLTTSQPQSPQLGSRTVVATALETDPPLIINEPSLSLSTNVSPAPSEASTPGYSGSQVSHASYVDRRGRTILKPVRELPV